MVYDFIISRLRLTYKLKVNRIVPGNNIRSNTVFLSSLWDSNCFHTSIDKTWTIYCKHSTLQITKYGIYIVHCTLYSVQCILYTIQCTLYSVQCTLYNVQCTLYSVHCTVYMYIVHCTVYIVQCTLYSVHCTVYIVHCTVYIVQCTLYIVQCTLYIVQCTLYTVHCTLYNVHSIYNVYYIIYSIRYVVICTVYTMSRVCNLSIFYSVFSIVINIITLHIIIVGSCTLNALLKPNALYALKNQKRTFNSRDQV